MDHGPAAEPLGPLTGAPPLMEDLEHAPRPGPPGASVLDYRGPAASTDGPAERPFPYQVLVIGFIALVATCMIAGFVVNLRHWETGNKDYATWYNAGQRFLNRKDGGDLYAAK